MNQNNLTKSIVIVLCFLIACTVKNSPEKEELENNQITLIFKSPPPKWRVYREAGGYTPARCEIDFIDDNFIQKQFFPDTEQEFDTLIFKTKRKFVEFRHSYKGIDKLSYLFHNGDTVLFTYRDKTPIASLLNRESKTHDVNFDLYKRKTLYPEDYPSYVKSRKPFLFMENSKNLQQELDRVVALANENFTIEINKERTLLDSLNKNNIISKEIYNFYSTQIIYQQKIIELQNLNGGPRPLKGIIPKLTKEDFNIHLGYDIEMGFIDGGNILDGKNDSLLYFGYHKDVIDWIYIYYLSRRVGNISSTHYINGVSSAGRGMPDYISLYDSIQTCPILSQQTKKVLKLITVQRIIENYKIDEANQAFSEFKTDVRDTSLINFIKRKYALPEVINNDSYDLELCSFHSEYLTFNELLERHKGKVIYLDFWSSGCPPCIKQFKHSKRLKILYSDKDLVQIYISSEPNKRTWEKNCSKFEITDESYLVSNRFTSKQLEDMSIEFIPRYMLFDKNGEMVIESAPRPDDKGLIKLIDKYLAEN